MERQLLILLVSAVALAAAGKHDIYSSNSVYGVKLRDVADQEVVYRLETELDVDVWQYGVPDARDTKLMLSPDNKRPALAALREHGIHYYEEIPDVARLLEEEEENLSRYRMQRKDRMIFQDYPRYGEIEEYMERMATQFPDLVKVITAGPSFEGRPFKYLTISTTNFEDRSKPIYIMGAMLHAREWVTTPVTLYSIFRLLENVRNEDRDLINDIDWVIMPVTNPDGYEYAHTTARLWRKTRSINPLSVDCIGTDGNRNFDVAFNTTGVSTNPCAVTYPGPYAFSEPETQYMRDIMNAYLDRTQIFMDIHSHGNYVLFGFGEGTLTPNVVELHHVAAAMGAAMDTIKLPQAGFYLIGNSGLVLYGTSGTAQDWGQFVGIPFSFTLELPGYGYAFSVPPEFIDQINEETWLGIAVTARYARAHYRARYNANN